MLLLLRGATTEYCDVLRILEDLRAQDICESVPGRKKIYQF